MVKLSWDQTIKVSKLSLTLLRMVSSLRLIFANSLSTVLRMLLLSTPPLHLPTTSLMRRKSVFLENSVSTTMSQWHTRQKTQSGLLTHQSAPQASHSMPSPKWRVRSFLRSREYLVSLDSLATATMSSTWKESRLLDIYPLSKFLSILEELMRIVLLILELTHQAASRTQLTKRLPGSIKTKVISSGSSELFKVFSLAIMLIHLSV